MVSFYSEKTAEYTVVPDFLSILNSWGQSVPIYFWKTREGNQTSKCIHSDEEVYVVAFFARRAKIDYKNIDTLEMKINLSLYEFSEKAEKFHIPVFCGLPIAHNIFELNKAQCLYFHINPKTPKIEPIIQIKNGIYKDEYITALSQKDIIDIVTKTSKKMFWGEAIEAMHSLYRKPIDNSRYIPWFARAWHYKPMYFVIKK